MSSIISAIISTGLALSMFGVSAPVQAAALTSGQVNAIIMLLQSFGADQNIVSSVEQTLTGGAPSSSSTPSGSVVPPSMGTSTPPRMGDGREGMPPGQIGKMICIALDRNLGPGAEGDDVKNLQEILSQDPNSGFSGAPTGFFGHMTQKAMMHFQTENGIASSSSASGTVGPATRAFFGRACGQGEEGNRMGTSTLPRPMMGGDHNRMPPPPPNTSSGQNGDQ